MCSAIQPSSFSEAILWAAFIAAQGVWGFSFGFFGSGSKTFLADKVRFASRAIFQRNSVSNLLCPKQKEFLRCFNLCYNNFADKFPKSFFNGRLGNIPSFLVCLHRGGLLSFNNFL